MSAVPEPVLERSPSHRDPVALLRPVSTAPPGNDATALSFLVGVPGAMLLGIVLTVASLSHDQSWAPWAAGLAVAGWVAAMSPLFWAQAQAHRSSPPRGGSE